MNNSFLMQIKNLFNQVNYFIEIPIYINYLESLECDFLHPAYFKKKNLNQIETLKKLASVMVHNCNAEKEI